MLNGTSLITPRRIVRKTLILMIKDATLNNGGTYLCQIECDGKHAFRDIDIVVKGKQFYSLSIVVSLVFLTFNRDTS